MGELGKLLKETRESKNITLEQIDKDLKIKPRYIEAIEAENFEIFPSMPMARGFIKNYAAYLDLNPAEVLELYGKKGSGSAKKWISRDKGITFQDLSIVRPRSAFNVDTLITLLIITALLGSAAFFVYTQYLEPNQTQILGLNVPLPAPVQQPVKSSAAAVVLPTPTPPPTDTPTPSPTPSPQYYTGVAVELMVHKRSWVQILVDDVKSFEGVLKPGDRPNWSGDKRVAIRAGNGGGIEVYVNGQNMGFMGEEGQVVDQVWEKVEEVPSAESTQTPTPMTNDE